MKKFLLLSLLITLFSCERDVVLEEDVLKTPLEEISYADFFNEAGELKLHEMEVVISQSEWDRLISLLNENLKSDEYVKADLIYRHTPGSLDEVDTITEVGLRIRGNTTRRLPYKNGEYRRAHFKIKFDERFEQQEGTPEYEERKKRTFADVEAVNLKWGREGDESDVSQMREIYQYDMMRRAGVYVPLTTSCHLILNVEGDRIDYGVYTAIEPIDDTFLEHNIGDDAGDLYKCLWKGMGPATLTKSSASGDRVGESDAEIGYEPSYDLKEGSLENRSIQIFIDQINDLSGDAFKTYIEANFDVDRFLRFTAMNVILGMPDDYWGMGNNYYLFFPENGKITFIPYDYDHGLGGGWHPFNTASADIYSWWDMTGVKSKPLMKILKDAAYKELYKSYLRDFALGENPIFTYSDYDENFFQVLEQMYFPYLDNDTDEGEVFEHYNESSYFSTKKTSISSQL